VLWIANILITLQKRLQQKDKAPKKAISCELLTFW